MAILWGSAIIMLATCGWSLYFSLTNFLVPAAEGTAVEDYLAGP